MKNFDREIARTELISTLAAATKHERAQLIEDYRRRSEEAYSPQTQRSYKMIIRLFNEWCEREKYSSVPPISPIILAEFVDDMGGRLAPNTIETRLWGIAELHRSKFLPSPTKHPIVKLALQSIRRKYGSLQKQAKPLGKKDVLAAIESLSDSRLHIRDKALLWIATDSWCRSSEIVAFKVRDLFRQDDGSSLLFISRSKTDIDGKGDFAFLSAQGTSSVINWIDLAGLEADDPILTKSQLGGKRSHLDPATISRILRRCTKRKDVSAHSTRVGGVHDALRLGCDMAAIMVAGRWTSAEMPARYGRRIQASTSAAAQVSAAFADNLEN